MDRGRVLLRAAQLLRDRRDELSRTLTLEMGKTLAEAGGEVGKAADFFEYYGGLGRADRGRPALPREPGRDVLDGARAAGGRARHHARGTTPCSRPRASSLRR